MSALTPEGEPSPLAQPVLVLGGVGPERAAQLGQLGIRTVEDLLLHRPRRYEDRRRFLAIAELKLNEPATARGSVVALGVKWFRQRQKSIFELILEDGTGRLHCRWWNLPFMEKYFAVGDEIVVFGKPLSLKPRTIDHPETEVLSGEEEFIHLNRITPIYPLTEGLAQRWLRGLIWRTLAGFEPHIAEPWSLKDLRGGTSLPSRLVLPPMTRREAIRALHFPDEEAHIEQARRRLALDEFIDLQRQIQSRRRNFEAKAQALPCTGDNHLIKPFLRQLGFKLTEAQTSVLREMRRDMAGTHPMRRLLQGDVGSGKTVVAACCALLAMESGYAVAMMAPTEVLAAQHFHTFSKWLAPLGIAVHIDTGNWKSSISTTPCLIIGTHALLSEGLALPGLGLVIIDEQQKFGVAQREQLLRKGHYPHLLVMTATPIPRTLGLTLYGELDMSVIHERPPGRGSVRTFVRTEDKLPKVWEFIRSKLTEGRQAYIVYPRVEDTGQNGIKAVVREFDRVQQALNPFRAGLLHGRLKSNEKEAVMAAFRDEQVQVLLATSLIEVGLDLPNATVMLIENAEQFGLAQLHQLRGRIGRGARKSYCILAVPASLTAEARDRLKVFEETTDGFRIAEADLKLRGPGQLLGQQQSGAPKLRFGDFVTDAELVLQARGVAAQLYVGS